MNKNLDIISSLQNQISTVKYQSKVTNIGKIEKIGDGVAVISGLKNAALNEILEFPYGIFGVALNLEENQIGSIILGNYEKLKEGDEVQTTGKILQVPVGKDLLGRVINPLGQPLDGKSKLETKEFYPIERSAPSVVFRQPVNTSLQTGIKSIDAMIPIGRGQRQLIIGDRSTGKTALAIDTIINQKEENVICIYVAIGQKTSKIAQLIEVLKKHDALKYTVIVVTSASDTASLQYIAPYAGCAIGEYFMDQGKDALVIYDDLSKHAWAYRQVSLLLRRPSGREAYPGDVFYLHSRLLERASRFAKEYGGGSLTALPIIETQASDLSAYIPTNVISITDGQIYLESDLFYAGIRPAINPGLSVSRVGGAAQIKAMKQVAGKLRLDLAQYRELAAFAQFGTDLDPKTKAQIDRGSRITEILKQDQYEPFSVEKEVLIFWAASKGYLDDIPVKKVKKFESRFLEFAGINNIELLKKIRKEKVLDKKIEEELTKLVTRFKEEYGKEFLEEKQDIEETNKKVITEQSNKKPEGK